MRRLFAFTILSAACLNAAEAFRWIERPFGDPELNMRGMAEAPDGTLTIATENRLFRFDGKRVVRYPLTLAGVTINAIAHLKTGELAIASDKGLDIWEGTRMTRVHSGFVHRLASTGDQLLFTVTQGQSIRASHAFRSGPGVWQIKTYPEIQIDSLFSQPRNGTSLVLCNRALCRLTTTSTGLQVERSTEPWFSEQGGVLEDQRGRFWGLKTETWSRFDPTSRSRIDWPVGTGRIVHVTQIEREAGEVCTMNGDALICRTDSRLLSYPLPIPISGSVESLHFDRHGVIWIAVNGYGLLGLARAEGLEQFSRAEGVENAAYHFSRLLSGKLIASIVGGLFQLDSDLGKWVRWDKSSQTLRYGSTAALPGGQLVAALYPSALRLLSPQGELRASWTVPNQKKRGYRCLALSLSGEIYFDVESLFRLPSFDPKAVPVPIALPSPGLVQDMELSPSGDLAVTSSVGLAVRRNGIWIQVDERHGLRQAALDSVAMGAGPNEYWVTYDHGIGFARIRINPNGSPQVENFGNAEGFSDVASFDVKLDRKGLIWRGATSSISFASPDALQPKDWRIWDQSAGINNPDVAANSMFEDRDGSIWVGTVGGILHFSATATQLPPRQPLHVFAHGPTPDPNRPGTWIIDLAHRYLLSPRMVHFQYRLGGPKSNWIPIDKDRLELSGLKPGQTRVEIRVAPSRFFEPANIATLAIDTPIPLWPIALGAALIAAGGYLLWRQRWHVLAIVPSPSLRRQLIRDAFTTLKSLSIEQRQPALARVPATLRREVETMLEAFKDIEQTEDPRTRSGVVLDSRYLLEHVIGKGGFATVYLGRDTQLTDSVAVKLFHSASTEGSWLHRRLEAETEAMRRLNHPSIVHLRAHGLTPDSHPYLVMDYVSGINLRQALREGPFAPRRAFARILEACDALAEVHAQGILHRDLKPENILLRNPHQESETTVLIDFGVASVYDSIRDGVQSTFFAGSLDYVAPEQIAGLRLESSDVYSMALILFELLTNQRFKTTLGGTATAASIQAALEAHLDRNCEPLAHCLAEAAALEHSRRTPNIQSFRASIETFRDW